MEGTIGEIRIFAGNFAPKNWLYCNGQVLSIASNTALFSILGTTYGGNGTTTFNLPDLQGRVPVGPRNGPGLQAWSLGEVQGTETVTLSVNNLPNHTHTVVGTVDVSPAIGSTNNPAMAFPAQSVGRDQGTGSQVQINLYGPAADTTGIDNGVAVTIGNNGGNIPLNNMQPFGVLNYIICQFGIFPSRG